MITVHVVPLLDLIEHAVPGGIGNQPPVKCWLTIEAIGDAEPCVCSPTPECVPNENGPDGWIWTHHSLDGRELNEAQA